MEVSVDLSQGRLCEDGHSFIFYYPNPAQTNKLNYV